MSSQSIESLVRLAILMAALTAILWSNANDFDATEIKSLAMFFLGSASIEGITGFLKLHKSNGAGESK